MTYIMLIIGFVFLIKGADFLVDGSSGVAKKMGISDLIIGLTIVSVGTSMPELIVNIIASLGGNADMAIGNVIGSNIANLLLILGVTACIVAMDVQRNTVMAELPFSIAAILMVGFLANSNVWGDADVENSLSNLDGFMLLAFFAVFFVYIFITASEEMKAFKEGKRDKDEVHSKTWLDIVLIIGGMLMLFFGGKWVVDSAVEIARVFNMSETFISLTVIAIGTSLPELVTSITAARKGSADVALGNIIGSNIFNALWILGLSSSIYPIAYDPIANFDLMIVVIASLVIIFMMVISRKMKVERWHGVIMLLGYIAYNIYIFKRG